MKHWLVAVVAASLSFITTQNGSAEAASVNELFSLGINAFPSFRSTGEAKAFETLVQNVQKGQPVETDLIRAEWLIWLCTDPAARTKVTTNGIFILNARIEGNLKLNAAKVTFPLKMQGCTFEREINLTQCQLESLDLAASQIPSLTADQSSFTGDVSLDFAKIKPGRISFQAVSIHGRFSCRGSKFITEDKEWPALDLFRATIDSDVTLRSIDADDGVVLAHTIIGGALDCGSARFAAGFTGVSIDASDARVKGAVSLRKEWGDENPFIVAGNVSLRGAEVGGLDCIGVQILADKGSVQLGEGEISHGLECNGTKFHGPVNFFDAEITGGVSLTGAIIGGAWTCGRTYIYSHTVAGEERALDCDGVTVGGNLVLGGPEFYAHGKVSLLRAVIRGDFDCTKGHFINGAAVAIDASSSTIDGNLLLRNFEANGRLNFAGAHIGEAFLLTDVVSPKASILDLRSAKARSLFNDEASWPKEVLLHGFIYEALDYNASWHGENQIKWLRLQPKGQYFFQPYDQMAATFRAMGLEDDAMIVRIAKNQDYGKHLRRLWNWRNPFDLEQLLKWLWYNGCGRWIDYGFMPSRTFELALCFIIVGSFIFGRGYRHQILTPTDDSSYVADAKGTHLLSITYPTFDALIYSFESLVPLLKLGMAQYWAPNPNLGREISPPKFFHTLRFGPRETERRVHRHSGLKTGNLLRWYLWFHITSGWILATLLIAALTGLAKP